MTAFDSFFLDSRLSLFPYQPKPIILLGNEPLFQTQALVCDRVVVRVFHFILATDNYSRLAKRRSRLFLPFIVDSQWITCSSIHVYSFLSWLLSLSTTESTSIKKEENSCNWEWIYCIINSSFFFSFSIP